MKIIQVVLTFLIFMVTCISSVFPEKLAVLPEFGKPGMIAVHGDELYVMENVTIYVYSMKDYCLLRKLEKEGEGPGHLFNLPEFDIPIRFVDGNMFLNSRFKMAFFTTTGKLIHEKRIPFASIQVIPLGKNYAISRFIVKDKGPSDIALKLYDSQLKELKTIQTYKFRSLRADKKQRIPPRFIYFYTSGDKLFAIDQMDPKKGFHIDVFDKEGNVLKPIILDYPKIELTESFKKEFLAWMKMEAHFKFIPEGALKGFYFSEYLPTIRRVLVKKKKICVQTYKIKNNLCEFIILNLNGKVLNKTFLPGAAHFDFNVNPFTTYTFHKNKYYYLHENLDNEEWELHMQEIK